MMGSAISDQFYGGGLKIVASEFESVCNNKQYLRRMLREAGIIWVVAEPNIYLDCQQIANSITTRFATETSRRQPIPREDTVSYLVDPGSEEMALHSEASFSPISPEAIWFDCISPANQGGESTACDGRKVWKALRKETKDLLLNNPVEYDLRIELNLDRELGYRDWFIDRLGCGRAKIEDGHLYFKSRRYAVTESVDAMGRLHLAFCNHLTCPLDYEPQILSRTIAGKEFPADLMSECKEILDQCTVEISLSRGDILFLENRRFMHGRRGFLDDGSRKIAIIQSETLIS